MAAKYEIKTAKNGKFFFNLKAANGQIVLTSQMYKSKDGALKGIQSVQNNAASDGLFERKTGSNDKCYFVLKAKNNQVIAQSQMYSTAAAVEKGIESVKKNGPTAETADTTNS